jgi:hypothetical protein
LGEIYKPYLSSTESSKLSCSKCKQFWGLEDFMNIKKNQVHNAVNLSMFMVNLSQALLQKNQENLGKASMI